MTGQISSQKPELAAKIAGGLAATAAGFAARKLITFGWKKVTGKEPPDEPESPEVAIGEAIGWAIVMGVGLELSRLAATRLVAKRYHHSSAPAD